MKLRNPKLQKKLEEALVAVLPVVGIVLVLCFSIAPVQPAILLVFLLGALLVILGMMFFTLGAEMSMSSMGERVGAHMTGTRKLPLIALLSFILGLIITVSEPDLQVLAAQFPGIPSNVLILSVGVGVGLFLVLAILRILLGISLNVMLIVLYIGVFALAYFIPADFRALAFDSGGVTTGPMTVPFIMALGVGISSIRNDSSAADDSFGLVALCSVGPIMAVLGLGLIFKPSHGSSEALAVPHISDSVELWQTFAHGIPEYMVEIAVALLPIVVFFAVYQIAALRLSGKNLYKILIGLIYTYIGLVLFLTGANVGFMPAGSYLGEVIASGKLKSLLIPVGALIGYFIVKAEPAVYVLNHQVEEITDGSISARAMGLSLSIGVACSVALSMFRVLTGAPVMYFLIPGYALALILSFFTPRIFTAIAFDSGGVASGPMTATFLLALAQGACSAVGGNAATDAFGLVAMVAMTPLITIQILGLVHRIKSCSHSKAGDIGDIYDDYSIIEL